MLHLNQNTVKKHCKKKKISYLTRLALSPPDNAADLFLQESISKLIPNAFPPPSKLF